TAAPGRAPGTPTGPAGPGAGEAWAAGALTVRPCGLCRESQVELREQIDNLAAELCRINEDQKVALDLDPYVKKLLNARRRVVLVNNILQNAQERLRRLNHSVAKETARRRAMLDSGVYPPGSPSK
uniref:Biogenesis of lysosome-related organelles complex 1 subunit 7 n=1 Tax=Ictidomys tridecemlineatus TaxID=43179 RepID=I3LX44_ICTTR